MATEDPRRTYEWEAAKQKVLKRDQYRCQSCGWTEVTFRGIDLHVHHIHAVEDGGGNDPANLVVLCNRCHNQVHERGPEAGEYPLSLATGRAGTFLGSRGNYTPPEDGEAIIAVLQENGPTQKKEIKEQACLEEWEFSKAMDHLRFGSFAGRTQRGVYAYIPREEYDRVEKAVGEGLDPQDIRYSVYDPTDPDSPGLNSNERMTDRTTISVAAETKELLDEHRDGEKWDRFLAGLIQNDSEDEGPQGTVADQDVYEEIRKLQELIEQMPATTAEHVRREFEENYRP